LVKNVEPVIFPLGRLRFATSPFLTGSPPMPKTTGIDVVAFLAASAALGVIAAIAAT
jgi:hypothetical protein